MREVRLLFEDYVHAAVAPALVLDFAYPYDADLFGVIYVRAATRLKIDVIDAHGSDVTGSSGWLHGHCPDKFGTFIEFGFGDCAKDNVVRFGDEHVNALSQVLLINLMLAEIKIQSTFFRPH